MSTTTITNVRIFDGEKVLEQNTIVIDKDGLISLEVPVEHEKTTSSTAIDGTGMTLLPGLWDTHVHLSTPGAESIQNSIPLLQNMIASGITSAIDCGRMTKKQYDFTNENGIAPHLFYTENFATSTGSTHAKFQMTEPSSIVDTVEAAITFVEERVKLGADYIKIVADVPGPSQEIINQLSKSAKEHGKPTIVHAARHPAYMMALHADPTVSIITHLPMDKAITLEEAKLMKEKNITSVPTLVMEETMCASGKIPVISFPPAIESAKALHAAGVPMLVGTDSNQSVIARVNHGEAIFREMELLEQVGMDPTEILHSATQLSAQRLGLSDRGLIASEKRADLVLVSGDPTKDIQVLKKVVKVWKGGKEVYVA